ncbi:hypothetical protein FKW77_005321 [Venturia effusa]|uniref:Uncharacterized protein n=1 Tax=Venturia effusa TaxID=50376 RepID=A0A517LK88_9PEZI|nr:hypothetical protein FKW77_005321 [Venturia effusa]
MDALNETEKLITTAISVPDQSAQDKHDTPVQVPPSPKLNKPKAPIATQSPTPKSIASLLLSLPAELRLDILTRAVYSETRIRLPHHNNRECKACTKDWDAYQDEVLSVCPIFRDPHDQLYHEALRVFLEINSFSIECSRGCTFLRGLLSNFVLEGGEDPTTGKCATGMTWIRSLEVESHVSSDQFQWPSYNRFLESCPQLSSLTIRLHPELPWNPSFPDTVTSCRLDRQPMYHILTKQLTTLILDVSDLSDWYSPGSLEHPWGIGASTARVILGSYIPSARAWFSKHTRKDLKVVVRILEKSLQKVNFQIQPRVQLPDDLCDKLGLEHGTATRFNQSRH